MSSTRGFGQRLKQAMEWAGSRQAGGKGSPLTAYALAKKCSVTQGYIGKLLKADDPQISGYKALELARALGVHLEWLLTGEGPMVQGDPLATATPLDLAAAVLGDSVGPQARRVVEQWADETDPVMSPFEWMWLLRSVQRQLAEGVPTVSLALPESEHSVSVVADLRLAR